MLKHLRLQTRLLLLIMTPALIWFIGATAFINSRTWELSQKDRLDTAGEIAARQAAELSTPFQKAAAAAVSLADILSVAAETPGGADREMILSMMRRILSAHPELGAIWTCWRTDAFDGEDAAWANTRGHDATGRFAPILKRIDDEIRLEVLEGYDPEPEWITAPERLAAPVLMEPGSSRPSSPDSSPASPMDTAVPADLIRFSVPVRIKGDFLAVAGIDLRLSPVRSHIAAMHRHDNGRYFFLLSEKGTVVAGPEGVTRAAFGQAIPQEARNAASAGRAWNGMAECPLHKKICRMIIAPMSMPGAHWAFGILLDETRLLSDATGLRNWTWLIGVGALVILFLLVRHMGREISLPLTRVSGSLNEGVYQIASAADEISSASHQLAEGVSEQAASLEETSASLEEMASMVRQNADNAQNMKDARMEVDKAVRSATHAMTDTTVAMSNIKTKGEEIGAIISTIDEIAFQTNLLALNAAVEAARAGEAGAGFAVVANEVRNLALKSAEAAQNTQELIEGTAHEIQTGSRLLNRTQAVFQSSAELMKKVGVLIDEIAAATGDQAEGISQISKAVMEMDKLTQSNASNAEETASASEELNAQARYIREAVKELLDMVGGRRIPADAASCGNPARDSARNADGCALSGPSASDVPDAGRNASPPESGGRKKSETFSPESVIPFDDDNFDEF